MSPAEQSQQSEQSLLSRRSQQRPTEPTEARVFASDDPADDIESAIQAALPTTPVRDNPDLHDRAAFELARSFKAIARLADAPPDMLRPYVRRFHDLAATILQKPWEETWADFRRAWKRVKFPAGAGPLEQAFERARRATPPRAAMDYEQPAVRLLVCLCRELQRAAGARPFFLSCRTAGKLLAVPHMKAWRWLTLLEDDGWIVVSVPGTKTKAARYLYREVAPRELGLN